MNREQIRQYGIAVICGIGIYIFLSLYLFLRRGYYDLYIINKVFAGTSLVLLGIVLLIGPLSRLYQRYDSWIIYRKELGIVAFTLAFWHSIISLFFMPSRFPLGYFQKNAVTFILGLTAVGIMSYLFYLSFERIIKKLDHHRWWTYQVWGIRITGVLVFLHVALMKYPGWLKWYLSGGSHDLTRPFMPPASIIAASFGLYVILVRIGEYFGQRIARFITLYFFIFIIIFLISLFIKGLS